MIALTTDAWTSSNQISVIGITAHWIEDVLIRSSPLAVTHLDVAHTGDNLAQALINCVSVYKIEKKVHIFYHDIYRFDTGCVSCNLRFSLHI